MPPPPPPPPKFPLKGSSAGFPKLPGVHPSQVSSDDLLRDCDVAHGRGSGPGGQRRNKVATAVRMTHRPTGITAEASERRSQAQNLAVAVFRLRVKLAVEVRTLASGVSEMWTTRTRGGRIACNTKHEDYPAMLAEALNFVMGQRGDMKKAALVTEVTATQLIRFIATEPKALTRVNQVRAGRGLHTLRGS